MTAADGQIRIDRPADGVGLLTIDRPAKRNAMTSAMIADFTSGFRQLADDEDIRAIVLTGAGDTAFCAGHDLNEAATGDLSHLYAEAHMQVFLLPSQTDMPVICALNGAAYAGGFCLALHSDLRIATPQTTFAVPGPRLGIVPIAGQSARLPHLLPPAIVNDMVMAGTALSATRAFDLGFVNAVVDHAELVSTAIGYAKSIAGQSPFAVRSYKQIARSSLCDGIPVADAMEYSLAEAAGHGPDVHEGLAAFREKRDPVFGKPKSRP